MEKDLIINGSLIIAFLFIIGQFFKNNIISPKSSIRLRLIVGLVFGLLGSCLMIFSIKVSDTIIIDMRCIALILSAISGGWVSVLVSTIIMSVTRLSLFGFNEASIMAVIVLLLLATCSIFILKMKCSVRLKYWLMNLFGILFTVIAFNIEISDRVFLLYLFLSYTIIFIFIAYLSFSVFEYIIKSNELFRRYKEESRIDFLTGLYNKRQFEEILDSQKEIVKEGKEQLSILAIDIDHFKNVNDTYGHPEGDKVLKNLGMILKKTTRKFDLVARCGGEEFAVMLLDCPYLRALEIAERIRSTVEQAPFSLSDGKIINITISIGVSSYPDTTHNVNDLLKQSDDALYQAKRTGRNKVCSFHISA